MEVGQEVDTGFQDEITQLSQRIVAEKGGRIKTEENVFQLLKSMVNDAKVDIENEKRERVQSEETMLQLLE